MADPHEELLQKGADILAARGDAPAEPEGPTLKPFVDKLSHDQFLDFGQQRIDGRDDVTALRNVFGQDRTILGEPGRGLRRGLRQLGDIGVGIGALGASAVGAEETVGDIGRFLQERQLKTSIEIAPLQEFKGAFDSPGNFVTWMAGVVGEQIPIVGSIIASGGAGTLIGRALAQRAITRQAASRAMDFTIRHSGEIGLFGGATTVETGSTAVDQLNATGTVNVPVAVIAGVVKGAFEGMVPLAFAKSFGIVDATLQTKFFQVVLNKIDDVRARPTKALLSALQTSPMEGVTEFAQTVVDLAARTFVDENFDAMSPESRAELLESAVTGAVVGFAFGGFAGAVAPQIGVPSDAPLAEFTDSDTGGVVAPPVVKDDEKVPPVLPIEPIDEKVPFVFADEDGNLIGREEGETLDFRNGVQGLSNLALNRRGNEVTRYFSLDNEDAAEKSALLEDLPDVVDDLEAAPGVTLASEEATAKAKDAIAQRNFALVGRATGAIESFKGQMQAARKLYQEALDLGFRIEPREGDGFTLVGGKALLREVTYEPSNFTGTPAGRFAFDDPSLREVITPGITMVTLGGLTQEVVPLSLSAKGKLLGSDVIPRGGKTFSVDVTRLPQDLLRVGSRLGFERMVERVAGLQPEGGLDLETQKREALEILITDGLITTSSDIQFSLLLDTLIDPNSTSAESSFLSALRLGAEIRPSEVTTENVAGLFFKGKVSSIEFLLASTQIPSFPRYLNERRSNVSVYQDAAGLQGYFQQAYNAVLKNGKKVDFANLKTNLTVLFGQESGLLNAETVDSKKIGGARLQALSLIRQLAREFNLFKDTKLVVIFSNNTKNGGSAATSADGVAVLHLNVRRFEGPSLTDTQRLDLADTVFHEFGHILVGTELKKWNKGETSQLLNAYTRDLFRAELSPINGPLQQYGAVPAFLSPRGVDIKESQGILPTRSVSLAQGVVDNALNVSKQLTYLLNFDEWIANNMSKWALNREIEPITALEKAMQRLGRLMKKYFRHVVGLRFDLFNGPKDFSPDLEFTKFVERIREKRNEVGLPVAQMLPNQGQQEVNYSPELNAPYEETAAIDPARKLVDFVVKHAKGITKEQSKTLRDTVTGADYFNGMVKWGFNILQLARLNPQNAIIQQYVAQTRKWHTEATQWKARVSENIREWERLGKVQADALGRFVFDVEQMSYLSEAEHINKKWRRPTAEELNELAQKHGLAEQSKTVYQLIVKDFDDFIGVVQTVEEQRINKEFARAHGLEAQLRKVSEEFNRLRNRPYFPHARFGQIAVVVKDSKGKTVHMEQVEGVLFSSGGKQAKRLVRELEKKLNESETYREQLGVEPGGFIVTDTKIPESVQVFRGFPPSMLRTIEEKLLRVPEGTVVTAEAKSLIEQQRFWIKELLIDMAPAASFRKRLGKRENVPGYSRDAMRSYADYFWHGSNYLARLTHGQDMQETLAAGERELSALLRSGQSTVKRRQIQEYLEDHYTNIMSPGPDWAQLRSASFSWWLGFVPASAILNLTQVPMVAWPFLSAQFGSIKAMNALKRGYLDIVKLNRNPVKALEETGDRIFAQLSRAVKQGFIDESWATEIAAAATGGNLSRMKHGNQVSRAIGQVGQAAAWMFQTTEAKVNRRVVFRAAIDLATANPESSYLTELVRLNRQEFDDMVAEGFSETEARAFLAGRDAVDRSQFEYASWARPRFMRGRLGVLFMFFMFVQNSAFFALKEPGQVRYLLMLMAMAGIMGLPGAEDMAAIAKFIARRLGFRFNVEEEVSRFVVDNFGGAVPPDLLLHGASRFGFGLPAAADLIGVPLPVFDMSAAIGMGRLVPGVAELGPPGKDFDKKFSRVGTDIAGATFGIGINFLKFMSDSELPWTDPKRFERAMPRALKNVSKMVRFSQEGRERTRGGATVAEFNTDEFEDIGEILLTGAGFQPRKLTREWSRKSAQNEAINYWKIRRGITMKQFSIAVMSGDKEARIDMERVVRAFNKDIPFRRMAITRDSLKRSLKALRRNNRLIEAGIPSEKMFRPLSQDIGKLFPSDRGGFVDVQDVTRIR